MYLLFDWLISYVGNAYQILKKILSLMKIGVVSQARVKL